LIARELMDQRVATVPGTPVVAIRGAGKTYGDGTCALARVDLTVHRGEFLALVGPSGCGKSTLLRLIAGLSRPTCGYIEWHANESHAPSARNRRRAHGADARRIGFVFQSPTLMPWARVATNVRLPLDLAGVARRTADATVADALARVHLTAFADHLPRQLSGGMQMRASIARALATEPELLLMDEPFGALDEFTRQRLDDDLLALWWAQRMTVVFVTHSIHEAVFLSSRVAVMAAHPGRVLDTWTIDAPYPRGDAFRVSTAFAAHAQRLSACVASAGADALPGNCT
jgi:NitT/TauT family transport system ATP-binding protein